MSLIDRLTRPPEFQDRCNSFLNKVRNEIAPDFPNIKIDATNVTEDDIRGHKEVLDAISEYWNSEVAEQFRQGMIRRGDKADRQSTFRYFATVDLWSGEPEHLSDMVRAASEIQDTSTKYKPSRSFRDDSIEDSPYNIHLSYVFSPDDSN